MSQGRNYQKELDEVLLRAEEKGERPSLLLHACCAPCSSYVMEYLREKFDLIVFYYNPNITEKEEYDRRAKELTRLAEELPGENTIRTEISDFDQDRFFQAVEGLEDEPEGGERCAVCFELRLREAAREAKKLSADYFATTLTISPKKDADVLNAIGERVAQEEGVSYLCSDFKKRDGYRRSVELSKEYDLYRQDYCGCIFSKGESHGTTLGR